MRWNRTAAHPPPPPHAAVPVGEPQPVHTSQLYLSSQQVHTCTGPRLSSSLKLFLNMKLPCCFGGLQQRLRKKSSTSDEAATNLLQNQILHERPAKLDDRNLGNLSTMLLPASALNSLERFVDVSSRTAAWYVPNLSATACTEALSAPTMRPGRFLIRPTIAFDDNRSNSSSASLELFLRTESGAVARYSIVAATGGRAGLSFEGHSKLFPTISALVVHHSIMREHLPALLALPRDWQRKDDQVGEVEEQMEEDEIDFIDIDCDAEFSELVSRLQGHVSF